MSKINWHYLVLCFLFCTVSSNDFAQKWVLKNPVPTNADLKGICLVGHDTGFVCGSFQTILKTTDGGLSWQHKGWTANNTLFGIAFSSRDTGFTVGWEGSILRTLNCGETWQQMPQPFPFNPSDLFDVFFLDRQHGWISGSYCGLLRTQDGGDSWQVLSQNIALNNSYNIVRFVSPDTGFIAGNKNFGQAGVLMKTTNVGITWTDLPFPAEIKDVAALEALSRNELWIGSGDKIYTTSGPATRIYHSLDGGLTWSSTDLMYYSGMWLNSIKFPDRMHGRVLDSDRMFTTSNGGITWQQHILSYDQPDLCAMAWSDSVKCLTTGASGYIFNSDNSGQAWNEVSHGTRAGFRDVFFTDNQTGFVVGYKQAQAAIYKTTDGGDTWLRMQNDTTINASLNAVSFADASNGWVVGYWGSLLHSTDAGQTWNPVDPGVQNTWFAVTLQTGKYIWAGGYQAKLIRSTDGGNSWQQITLPYPAYDIKKISFPDSLHGYITLAKSNSSSLGLMFRTTDGGVTWDPIDFVNSQTKAVLSMSFSNIGTGYVSIYNEGLAKTIDGGITWQSLGTIGSVVPGYLKFINTQHGIACLGDNFVAVTNDGALTWDTMANTQPGTGFISNYFFTDTDHGWLAGLHGLIEAWSSTGTGILQQYVPLSGIPLIFPNPANDRINIDIPGVTMGSRLEVVNAQGQILLTRRITGSKTRIDISNLPAGVYIVRLMGDKTARVGKFVKQ